MKPVDNVLEQTLLRFGKGETPEQQRRNQRNLVALRKMIDASRINHGIKNQLEKNQWKK